MRNQATRIRKLKANEISIRVSDIKDNGCFLILYKNARCDQKILDETFGIAGWQRTHQEVNGYLFCTVEVFDRDTGTWIKKQDVGTVSKEEREKGHASDAFKRACVNLGIGRELYTSPLIWIPLSEAEITMLIENPGKKILGFYVKSIRYRNEAISHLMIADEMDRVRYVYPQKKDTSSLKEYKNRMDACRSIEELKAVWHEYRHLQKDKEIESHKDKRKAEILAAFDEEMRKGVKDKFDTVLKTKV